MLEASWESHATVFANVPTSDALVIAISQLVANLKLEMTNPASVIYARDTRPSGVTLMSSLEDGLKCMDAEARNEGVTTTPILHYLVKCVNTKGTADSYGDDSQDGYFKKLTDAFHLLMVCPLVALH